MCLGGEGLEMVEGVEEGGVYVSGGEVEGVEEGGVYVSGGEVEGVEEGGVYVSGGEGVEGVKEGGVYVSGGEGVEGVEEGGVCVSGGEGVEGVKEGGVYVSGGGGGTELYSKGFGQTDIRNDEDVGTDEDNLAAEDKTTHLDGTLTEQDAVDHKQEEESPHDTETDTQAPQTSGNNGHLDDEGEKQTEILSSDITEDRQAQGPSGTLAGSQQPADCMPAPQGSSQDRPCRKKNLARGRTTRKTSQTRLNSQGSIIDSIRRAHSAEQGKDTQREKGNTASNNVAHKK
ncbi:hypothetical protein ACOMHN_031061 [Nucella lapillus]